MKAASPTMCSIEGSVISIRHCRDGEIGMRSLLLSSSRILSIKSSVGKSVTRPLIILLDAHIAPGRGV